MTDLSLSLTLSPAPGAAPVTLVPVGSDLLMTVMAVGTFGSFLVALAALWFQTRAKEA